MRYRLWANRTICDVLQEMRKLYKTRNFSYLPALIEEAQSMANRMEAGLNDKHDIEDAEQTKKSLKQEIRKLEDKKNKLSDNG